MKVERGERPHRIQPSAASSFDSSLPGRGRVRQELHRHTNVRLKTTVDFQIAVMEWMGREVPGQRPVVLVVEDESLIRMNAMAMVQEAGFHPIAASDADEAIRILESRNDIQAVFTDVHMPGSMDGIRLARVVRNRWPPVALIVTSGQTNVLETDLPTGGRFLRKPYEPVQLETALRQLIC